jgi:tetratricopeptide (TPR) repeat protein
VGPAVVALVAQSTAWVTVQAGRLREGLELFEQAAAAYTSAGLPMAEHYIEYVDALLDLWLLPEARRAAREATDALDDVPLMGEEARLRVAQIAVLAEDAAEAEAAAEAAVSGFERQHRPAWTDRARLVAAEARLLAGRADGEDLRVVRRVARRVERSNAPAVGVHAHLIAGRLATAIGRPRPALESLNRAAELSRGAPALVRLRGQVAAALAARLQGRDGEALRRCARGLQDLNRHRSALPSMELRARASSHGVELGRIGVDLAIRSGSAARVLSWMERTRAAALLAVEPPPAPELADDLAALRAVQAELNSGGRDDPGTIRKTGVDRLVARQREIEERIRRATWRQAAPQARGLAPAAVPDLRRALGHRTLVEFGRSGDDLVAVVVGARRTRLVPLGPVSALRPPSDALFFALRRLSRPRPDGSLAAARMSADAALVRLRRLLLEPLGIDPEGELVVVPFGLLHGLPWPALHHGPVTATPSATFWVRTRGDDRPANDRPLDDRPGNDRIVIVAGPELEGAQAEALALGRLYPEAELLSPPQSTVAAVVGALAGARTAHFACHGRLRSDNPMFSSLLLSDGSLTVQELAGQAGAPHRVILAACESGNAVHYAGDEFVGFVSALMARGTAGVLASIAAIPDVPTATLMIAVHERLRAGATLSSALHGARATLDSADPATFVTWCTLTAYGAA